MTLTEFLLARIAEEEAAANLAIDTATAPNVYFRWRRVQRNDMLDWADDWPTDYTPARIVAECEAKRQIVEEHPSYDGRGQNCATCCASDEAGDPWCCTTLLAVASVYADHPDYREEWRP